MGEDYDRAVEALPRMTPEERDGLSRRLAALRALQGRVTPVPATQDAPEAQRTQEGALDEVLGAVCAVVLRASGERASVPGLRRTRQSRALAEKSAAISEFLGKNTRTRVERRALLELGMDLLYRQLRDAGYPVSARTLLAHAHRLPAAVDVSFPGYAALGMLGMVIRSGATRAGGR